MATYKIGSSGDEVKKIQTQLKAAGYDPGGIDGIYGKNTAAAVTAYQKANNLTADGLAGNQTLGKLYGGTTTVTPTIKPVTAPVTPLKPTSPTSPTVNSPDITGLTGLRDYGTGKGLDIGWGQRYRGYGRRYTC